MLGDRKTRGLGISIISVLALILGLISPVSFSTPAVAADSNDFSSGNIFTDEEFFNGSGMTASEIQLFLDSMTTRCSINDGNPSHASGAPYSSTQIADSCLKGYSQATPDMAPQPGFCSAYQGMPNETAASIISKVGLACNINPKILLVLLQKEQSLVTDTWPTVQQFERATGFICYDNGQPCSSDYPQFFYQVWGAARQFQRYGTGSFNW